MSGRRRRLVELRKAAGHTQHTLADALRVHPRTIIRWEDGSVQPHPGQRRGLAAALRVSLDELADLLHSGHDDKAADDDIPSSLGEVASPPAARSGRSPRSRDVLGIAIAVAVGCAVLGLGLWAVGVAKAGTASADQRHPTPLVSVNSGKCVAILEPAAVGAQAYQEGCTGQDGRTWRLRPGPDGTYQLVGSASAQCLGVGEQKFGAALVVAQRACEDNPTRLWELLVTAHKDGWTYGRFVNRGAPDQCLDINGATVGNDAHVIVWHCGTQLNQSFRVVDEALQR